VRTKSVLTLIDRRAVAREQQQHRGRVETRPATRIDCEINLFAAISVMKPTRFGA
jgi:hypothetical protein